MLVRPIKVLCFTFVGLLAISSGCYQRPTAPEVTYDQSDVEVLKKEMKKFEWE
ncbi:MAG: hypothetical protein AB8B55_16845 [Mariniblastus sp.]